MARAWRLQASAGVKPKMRIDVLGLEAFLSIAERGSFHRAAAHLNLSQTALSHRMKKLEDDLGIKLFTRSTRQVTLTPAGLELLPRAQQLMTEISASFEDLRKQGRSQQRSLGVGCLPTIATHVLPPLLNMFRKQFPHIALRIFDNSAREIAEKVLSGEAEFGITIVSAQRWDLDVKPLMKEPYVLLVPQGHALAQKTHASWADLEGEPLVRISPLTGNRMIIDDALGSRREAMMWRYEVQHAATAMALVAAGVGLTIVPRLGVDKAAVPGLIALPLRDPGITRTLGLVQKRGLPLSPAGAALFHMIETRMRMEE